MHNSNSFFQNELLIRLPFSILLIIALISTLSIFFFLYRLSIFWTFHNFAIIIFIIIIIYLSLFLVNLFNENENPNELLRAEFNTFLVIGFPIFILILLLIHENIYIKMLCWCGVIFFGCFSWFHLIFLTEKGINNYLIIHLSLYMDILSSCIICFIFYLYYLMTK